MNAITVVVTGAKGFLGRNLCAFLRRQDGIHLIEYDVHIREELLDDFICQAQIIYHLAGVNRPTEVDDYHIGNAMLTKRICDTLKAHNARPKLIFSSSIQAELDNPYGRSKRAAEEIIKNFSDETGAECIIYRLKNLFGKWCHPNYNSVVATFCYNIAHDLPIQITEPSKQLELIYIDDVVKAFMTEFLSERSGFRFAFDLPSTSISLGELAEKIMEFHQVRSSLHLPGLSEAFDRELYATYLSYFDNDKFDYQLTSKVDHRGSLAEFLKSKQFGQIFISRTKPGVQRGNHYHQTKVEKFLVVEGEALIRFRHIEQEKSFSYIVKGDEYRVVDIPPGYSHSIENVGDGELIVLFWSSEIFEVDNPDTYTEIVSREEA